MTIDSPRKGFRGSTPVPLDWPDQREWLILVSKAIHSLQGNMRKHPVNVVSLSATYTMVDVDSLLLVDASGGDKTVFLLTAAGREGREVFIKKTDSSENLVVIDPKDSETIDSSSTISLTQKDACRGMMSDGTNWRLISAIGNSTAL